MKQYITLLTLLCFCTFTTAQNITNAEYFIDTDPGVGQGTTLTINNTGTDITDTFTVNVGNLSVGYHRLYTRVQDANGVWSHYDKMLFYVAENTAITNPALPNITAIEYFIDTDPGLGLATSVAVNTIGTDITDSFTINIGVLTQGFHRFYTRVQDANGIWSMYDKFLFYVSDGAPITNPTLPTIVAAEYFLGVTDPGFGNATAVALTPTGNNEQFMIDVDFSGFTSCTTTPFHLRVQDTNGVWSLYDFDPAVLIDFEAPIADAATLNEVQGVCEVTNITAPTATDGCTLTQMVGTTDAVFPITLNTTITWTYNDGNGNTSTQAQNVVITDSTDPVASGQNITVDLGVNGSVTITSADVDNGSNDNCGSVALSIMPDTFTSEGVFSVTLTATDIKGNTNDTVVQVTVTGTLSINTITLENLVEIYPIPSKEIIFISTEVGLKQLIIYDLVGKKVKTQKQNLNQISLHNLSKGIYLLELTSLKGNKLIKRIIKN
ncbi:T9SS type A sorting domain-containing protein [Lacinutrix jangbogonensis]|uniref:T9SS type A sorting domain-containing protein n=1 Tax=Lacinutrix jangbogonensis TaxID=1469557 RepID=UPI00053E5DC2|nr:T9SS type A sorting domain-containing protein [Lacinutrix jangbogonensis]